MELNWQEVGQAGLVLATAVVLSWLFQFVLSLVVKRLVRRTETHLDDAIIGAIRFPLQLVIVVIGLEIALNQLSDVPVGWRQEINRIFFVTYTLLVFIFLFRLLSGLADWYADEIAHRTETQLDDLYLDLFKRVSLLILTTVVIVIVLGHFGVEISALVTTLGIGSLAVALAAQETLRDMFAGFTILVDQPFKVGDRVELLDIDTWGDVQEIGMRSTRIRTRDNRMVTVPNSVIGKGLVVNYSVPNTVYRVETHGGWHTARTLSMRGRC